MMQRVYLIGTLSCIVITAGLERCKYKNFIVGFKNKQNGKIRLNFVFDALTTALRRKFGIKCINQKLLAVQLPFYFAPDFF